MALLPHSRPTPARLRALTIRKHAHVRQGDGLAGDQAATPSASSTDTHATPTASATGAYVT